MHMMSVDLSGCLGWSVHALMLANPTLMIMPFKVQCTWAPKVLRSLLAKGNISTPRFILDLGDLFQIEEVCDFSNLLTMGGLKKCNSACLMQPFLFVIIEKLMWSKWLKWNE